MSVRFIWMLWLVGFCFNTLFVLFSCILFYSITYNTLTEHISTDAGCCFFCFFFVLFFIQKHQNYIVQNSRLGFRQIIIVKNSYNFKTSITMHSLFIRLFKQSFLGAWFGGCISHSDLDVPSLSGESLHSAIGTRKKKKETCEQQRLHIHSVHQSQWRRYTGFLSVFLQTVSCEESHISKMY